ENAEGAVTKPQKRRGRAAKNNQPVAVENAEGAVTKPQKRRGRAVTAKNNQLVAVENAENVTEKIKGEKKITTAKVATRRKKVPTEKSEAILFAEKPDKEKNIRLPRIARPATLLPGEPKITSALNELISGQKELISTNLKLVEANQRLVELVLKNS
ncbi:MAG: hypothetical protein LBS03_06250, partial [Bacteroidales bacterium]|nr:hypothetical protein [Bacteroidales bacterium]